MSTVAPESTVGRVKPTVRAAAIAGLGEHCAAVRFDDVAHDGQSEAGSGQAPRGDRSVEAIEDVR